jgi:hypothetical protein
LSRFDTAAISTAESQSTVQRYGGHELLVTDARHAHPLPPLAALTHDEPNRVV